MKVPLGAPQRPGFTAGDKNNSDPARFDERPRVLAAALTCVRRGALMTATVGAALVTAGTVAVVGAEFSAHSHAPVILGTDPWFICGEDGDTNTCSCPFSEDWTGKTSLENNSFTPNAGGTQRAPQSNTQHLCCAGQSSSHAQPLCDGTTCRSRGQ